MSKHTPGPWTAFEFSGDAGNFEIKAGKFFIAETNSGLGSEEESNARLIAAAPDYHEGAMAFIAYEDAMSSGDDISAMLHYANASKLLRAAKSKATGQ